MKPIHHLIGWPVALCIFLATQLSLRATDITWINPAGGDWNTAANWNTGQAPGPADKAILALAVTVTLDSSVTVSNLDLSNGALSGNGVLTVSGTLNWTGGTMNGSGTTVMASGATLAVSGPSTKNFGPRTLQNNGMMTVSGGEVRGLNGAVFNNGANGLVDFQGDLLFYNPFGGSVVFNNAGTVQKSGGTGATTIGMTFNNNGALNAQSGTLSLTADGDSHGTFDAAAGATLNFSGAPMTLESNSTVTAAGTVSFSGNADVSVNGGYSASNTVISGATANFNSNVTLSNVTLSGGLGGSGTVTVSGTLNWTGGGMAGGGTTVIASGATVAVSGGNVKTFGPRTLNNSGTMTASGGEVRGLNGAVFNNGASGLVDFQGDLIFYNPFGGSVVFNNSGTVQKSGGTGATTIGMTFNNNGALNVQSGTINVTGSPFSNGANGVVQGSGTVDVSHTTFTTDGTFSPGNPLGNLLITGNLPQSSNSVINIQIGGTNAGVNYDQLIVTGSATLNGALNVSLVNGFRPSGSETFEIIKYASHTGSFDNISGLDLGGGFFLEPTFGSTNLILTTIDNRPRPQFSPLQSLPNGEIRITLSGVAGQTFVIQATTNFASWDSVLTNVNSGAVFDLIITDSSFYPYRFYRTFQP